MTRVSRLKRAVQAIASPDVVELQKQLHEANQRRLADIEAKLAAQDAEMRAQKGILAGQDKQLALIVANTSGLQDLKEKVESIEEQRNKVVGGLKLGAWVGGSGIVTALVRAFWPHHG